MTSVIKITCLFAGARDNRTKVTNKPNDNHFIKFKEDLLNVYLQIAFKGTDAGNPSSAIFEDTRYQVAVATSTPYDFQVAAQANYDPDLQSDKPARRAKEENWAASTRYQSRKRAIECGANNYLLRIVDPTWPRLLKNEATFFTRVTPIDMLAKITKVSGDLERVDTFNLLVSHTQLWEQDLHVPEYLNGLRDDQK